MLPPAEVAVRLPRNLSADGDRVFFQTTEPLLAADTNGAEGCAEEGGSQNANLSCQDAYEWEAEGSGSCQVATHEGGCLYLLSSGKSPQASFFLGASESGEDAFIATAEPNLVRQDQDGLFDVFDARVGGGFAAQNRIAPPPCEEEGCKGPVPAAPTAQTPATATQAGPGNAKPPKPKRCPKGRRRVEKHGKVRCVKRGRAKKHRGAPRDHRTGAGR